MEQTVSEAHHQRLVGLLVAFIPMIDAKDTAGVRILLPQKHIHASMYLMLMSLVLFAP